MQLCIHPTRPYSCRRRSQLLEAAAAVTAVAATAAAAATVAATAAAATAAAATAAAAAAAAVFVWGVYNWGSGSSPPSGCLCLGVCIIIQII